MIGAPQDGLPCTVGARTFRGNHVAVKLQPEHGPVLDAECPLNRTPDEGARVGVTFAAAESVVLPAVF